MKKGGRATGAAALSSFGPEFMRLYFFLCISVCITGCAGSRSLLESPDSIADINLALQRYPARIILEDGKVVERVRNARIDSVIVSYGQGRRQDFPLAEVTRIEVDVHSGRETGTLVGMAPGVVLMGFAAAAYALEPADSWGKLGALYIGAIGFVGTLVGGVIGDLVGGAVGETRTYILYERSADADTVR